jgi:hypothetical protein
MSLSMPAGVSCGTATIIIARPDPRWILTPAHYQTYLCCLQVKCTLFQVDCAAREDSRGSVKYVKTLIENGAVKPPPLIISKSTGGSGCSAGVASKAEALHAALCRSSEAATAGTGSTGSAGGSTQAGTAANSALVECAVCRRKPGDPGVPATLKLCGGCKSARYCSEECQRKEWKMGHKGMCQLYQQM